MYIFIFIVFIIETAKLNASAGMKKKQLTKFDNDADI